MDFGIHCDCALGLPVLTENLVLNQAFDAVDPLEHVTLFAVDLQSLLAETGFELSMVVRMHLQLLLF